MAFSSYLVTLHDSKKISPISKCYFSEEIIALTVPTGFEPATCGSRNRQPMGTPHDSMTIALNMCS